MYTIEIDRDLCNGCGSCVEGCPMEVLVLETEKATPEHPEQCMFCLVCEVNCPEGAIKVKE
jgi:NAD-dependent dihydropyrimidine dehydrogenase PreA subunit